MTKAPTLLSDKCPTCGHKKTRSQQQNRRYHAILRELSVKLGFTVPVLHEYCKQQFLGVKDVVFPNGKPGTITISTANLTMHGPEEPNWETYMLQVEHFAAENGVIVED